MMFCGIGDVWLPLSADKTVKHSNCHLLSAVLAFPWESSALTGYRTHTHTYTCKPTYTSYSRGFLSQQHLFCLGFVRFGPEHTCCCHTTVCASIGEVLHPSSILNSALGQLTVSGLLYPSLSVSLSPPNEEGGLLLFGFPEISFFFTLSLFIGFYCI